MKGKNVEEKNIQIDDIKYFFELDLAREYLHTALDLIEISKNKNYDYPRSPIIYIFKHSLELISKIVIRYFYGENYSPKHEAISVLKRIVGEGDKFILSDEQIKYVTEINPDSKIDSFDINFTHLINMIDMYFIKDQTNTQYRYVKNTVTFQEKKITFEKIEKDIIYLTKFMVLLLGAQSNAFNKMSSSREGSIQNRKITKNNLTG
jgi:hypothetical protein